MKTNRLTRRELLGQTVLAGMALATDKSAVSRTLVQNTNLPSVRAITSGPRFHWFGYYDKLQFDPTCRFALGMEVDFEHRSPRPDDVIRVGMVDLDNGDRWRELGRTTAWCWQQGCMLQWIPGSSEQILWNDRRSEDYVCHVLNVKTGEKKTLSAPIYTLSPDGRTAVTPDFRRINDMRPGYGYAGIEDPHAGELAPKDTGIFRVDLLSGRKELIISLADIANFGQIPGNPKNAKHYFNHLLFNTDGSRFIFLHRWRSTGDSAYETVGGFGTRMLTASPDGSDLRVVDPHGKTSHFIWRDPNHILAWAWHPSHGSAFYLYQDGTDKVEVVGKDMMPRNGHCTYLPGNQWILNDTYPDRNRNQHVYLYHVASGKKVPLGRFHLPGQYKGEWRCDTHPRFSPDGRSVVIDSPHGGNGRQMYLIDISDIIA